MARTRAQLSAPHERESLDAQGERPQYKTPLRCQNSDPQMPPVAASTSKCNTCSSQQDPLEPVHRHQGHKRKFEDTLDPTPDSPGQPAADDNFGKLGFGNDGSDDFIDPVEFWTRKGRWPSVFFVLDTQQPLARKGFVSSPTRTGSDYFSIKTPSDEMPREEKSAQYRDPNYMHLLASKGAFMRQSEQGTTRDSKSMLRNLLCKKQKVPQSTLFDKAVFARACQNLQGQNEARVIQDISRLIVPSAETLALCDKRLRILKESVNAGWNRSIALLGARPQPDYSVGFQRGAFTDDQLSKLSAYIESEGRETSFFEATTAMSFPFLTCEVKCGAAALDVADCQNAHSMVLAVRAVVELFRLVNREQEVNRQVLAFSISHDDRSVRIYGHYPEIDGKGTKYYRHPIHEFSFQGLDGKEKWTAYQFTRNVYDIWMPLHLKRICSAIDELPDKLDLDPSSL